MRFVTFRDGQRAPSERLRCGLVVDGEIYALPDDISLLELLRAGDGALQEAGRRARQRPAEVRDLAGADLQAPLPVPPTIRDFMTFEQHASSFGMLPDVWYQQPLFYFTNPYAVVGPDGQVPVPPGCERFDFELEVAAVIGSPGADLTPEQAEDCIAGFVIFNDFSARDLQMTEMQGRLGPAKGKDTATGLGPMLVTADELARYRSGPSYALTMRAYVNDELFGEDRMDSMAWSFGEMIAHASRGTWVRPGDVLGSGTCGDGCIAERWNRKGPDSFPPLRPGDTVSLDVEQLGTLRHHIVAGAEPVPMPTARRAARQ